MKEILNAAQTAAKSTESGDHLDVVLSEQMVNEGCPNFSEILEISLIKGKIVGELKAVEEILSVNYNNGGSRTSQVYS